MSLQTIRKTHLVPAKRYGRIRYTGTKDKPRIGTIVGSHGGYLRIRLDGDKQIGTYHPTWMIEYL